MDGQYTRLVIRNLRLDMGIGAYAHEHGITQPVLVNLVADVEPPADWQADSYENVVCYDTLTKQIRALAVAGHINLVETFAERIAAAALATKGILRVSVRVEKTAVIPDAEAVGIEIFRARG